MVHPAGSRDRPKVKTRQAKNSPRKQKTKKATERIPGTVSRLWEGKFQEGKGSSGKFQEGKFQEVLGREVREEKDLLASS